MIAINKDPKFNIELAEVEGSSIKIPVHSRVAIVCSLKGYHEVGDHHLYICNAEQVDGDDTEETLFAWNGYARLRPANYGVLMQDRWRKHLIYRNT
ncbi:MAG TPA: flavin reductase family protein [Firmicutes bacterium]|nr:flavin reductase family protein [Bacillota bacterium]